MLPLLAVSLIVAIALGLGVVAFSSPKNRFADEIASIDASTRQNPDAESSLLRKLLDEGRRDHLGARLQQAGWTTMTPAKMVTRSITYAAIALAFAFAIMLLLHRFGAVFIVMAIVLVGFAANLPYSQLNAAIDKRKKEIHRALPDFLDLLSTTVEAGIALNGAINIAAEGLHGALGEELRAAMQDIRLGRSRAEALAAMAHRAHEPDLTTVITAIVQSERLGANVSTILRDLSAESRERRILRAEEIAASLANKLVFPMALCMLPALMLIIFGGVLAKFVR